MVVIAELGRTTLPVSQAKDLQVGDVLCLGARATDPATVFVGGKPKFLGWPAASTRGAQSVQIAGRIPPHLQVKYEHDA